jgi:hypothetical protein
MRLYFLGSSQARRLEGDGGRLDGRQRWAGSTKHVWCARQYFLFGSRAEFSFRRSAWAEEYCELRSGFAFVSSPLRCRAAVPGRRICVSGIAWPARGLVAYAATHLARRPFEALEVIILGVCLSRLVGRAARQQGRRRPSADRAKSRPSRGRRPAECTLPSASAVGHWHGWEAQEEAGWAGDASGRVATHLPISLVLPGL